MEFLPIIVSLWVKNELLQNRDEWETVLSEDFLYYAQVDKGTIDANSSSQKQYILGNSRIQVFECLPRTT